MIQSPHVLAMYDPYSSEYVPPSDSDVVEVFPNRKGGIPLGFGNIPPPPSIPISPKKRIPLGGTRGASPTPHNRDISSSSGGGGERGGGERRSLSCSRTIQPDSNNEFTNGNGYGDAASSSSRNSTKQSSTMTLFRSNSASRDIRPKDTTLTTDRMQTIRGPSGISDRPGPGSRSANMGSDTPPISPIQAVNIRPSFSRLGIAGGGYHSTQGVMVYIAVAFAPQTQCCAVLCTVTSSESLSTLSTDVLCKMCVDVSLTFR